MSSTQRAGSPGRGERRRWTVPRTVRRWTGRALLALALAMATAASACGSSGGPATADGGGPAGADSGPGAGGTLGHSSTIALSGDGATLYVVNPDADSASVISTATRSLTREIPLAGAHPAVDPDTGDFTPAVMPRALALSPDGRVLYVTGQRSGRLYAVNLVDGDSLREVAVGSEPVGVVVAADGAAVFVACSEDDTVVRVDAASMTVTATARVSQRPWALALSADQTQLWATHFLDGRVSAIDPAEMSVTGEWSVPDADPRGDRRLAHGEVRGLYDLAPRPGTDEVWVAHTLLGTDVAQPALDFESTAFPALSLLGSDGAFMSRLSTDAADVPGIDGAFGDVVSGPRALAFTHDGDYALVVNADSEDVMAVDANTHSESTLLRPLPGHLPQGIVISADDRFAYIDERNTSDIAVVKLERTRAGLGLAADGAPIPTLASDPMPATLRLGQHLFYSANSDELPLTRNHWIACATCHMEGRSDAVTWRFAQGPRDTPSNAGGMLGTGFLFRTADRNQVQDYWQTINVEQGGTFDPDDPTEAALLDALAAYVNHAIPLPVPPATDPALVAEGDSLFHDPTVGCSGCHSGPRFTDSGAGNPTLDLAGTVLLHDVGTCVTDGDDPDVAHTDIQGDARAACRFDTPSLLGVADSAPYLHDGSAATLHDVLDKTRGTMGDISSLSPGQEDALVEYLRSL